MGMVYLVGFGMVQLARVIDGKRTVISGLRFNLNLF